MKGMTSHWPSLCHQWESQTPEEAPVASCIHVSTTQAKVVALPNVHEGYESVETAFLTSGLVWAEQSSLLSVMLKSWKLGSNADPQAQPNPSPGVGPAVWAVTIPPNDPDTKVKHHMSPGVGVGEELGMTDGGWRQILIPV